MNGLPGVEVVRSASKPGLSMVQVVFRDAAQLQNARQLVSERLQQLRTQLPASADSPDISPPLSPLGTVLQYAFTLPDSATADEQLRLRSLVQTTYENALLAIPGVAQVTIYGGDLPQTQVQLNLAALQQRNLALADVVQATRDSLFNGRGGVQVAGGQERLILPPTFSTASADLERAPVRSATGEISS